MMMAVSKVVRGPLNRMVLHKIGKFEGILKEGTSIGAPKGLKLP
jgi:hypothetical protein